MEIPKCVTFENTAKKYHTSTGKSHRFIPSVPEGFDAQDSLQLTSFLRNKDITIKNEQFQTVYAKEFSNKRNMDSTNTRAQPLERTNYLRNAEEKISATPPVHRKLRLTETKDLFRMHYLKPYVDPVEAPVYAAKCYMEKSGCEQQPSILPDDVCFWRLTDPYLTINRKDYVHQRDKNIHPSLKTMVVTQQNANQVDLPNKTGNPANFDVMMFPKVLPNRLLGEGIKRPPNYCMQSNYQEQYVKQAFSYVYPYLHESSTDFEDSLSPASRWQTLPIPGMYCSEYCNIGGKAVRRVVGPKQREITRVKHCPQI